MAPDPAWPGPRHLGRRFPPPRPCGTPRGSLATRCKRRGRTGPSANNYGRGEGHGSVRSPPRGAPRTCGARGWHRAAAALRERSRWEKSPPSSPASSPPDSRPGRSRFKEVWWRGKHLGVRTRALHQHTQTHGSAVPTSRPCTPDLAPSARGATRAQADTCHPAGTLFNRGKSAKGK